MACVHVGVDELKAPRASQAVYREDCTQCFDSIDHPSGLNVCLYCFNGGCAGDRDHALIHNKRSGHPLVLNIKRTRKETQRDEPPQKISKLAISAESEEDQYDTETRVICYGCAVQNVDKTSGKLPDIIDGVMKALTFSRQEEVKAWEQEFAPCEHTLCLEQHQGPKDVSQELGQCSMCSLKENLWLCLECGNLGCGRSQFGGIGGNSHGLAHADSSSHGVAVKLGSITPEGSADIYCYKCNEERIDPDLATHLSHWGINLNEQEKTEKSLMEMQLEHNLKWDFSMTTDDGQELKPLVGGGFMGLRNLGNSCYLSSVVQCLFSLPEIQGRYYQSLAVPPICDSPADDLETQLRKIADGLLSDRYVKSDVDSISAQGSHDREGLAPAMLKHLVGRGHEEFSTMRQQDAFEFLLHLFKLISLANRRTEMVDPIGSFRFALEQRLQCLSCKKVRYKVDEQDNISIPIPARRIINPAQTDPEAGKESGGPEFETVTLKECLDIFTGEEVVELTCSSCGSKDGFRKRSMFKTFPENLVVNARRFELVNWVPTKLNIPVDICDGPFDMSCYLSPGIQDDEELLPDEPAVKEQKAFEPNQAALGQLVSMGFPQIRCEKALQATGNSIPEAAMEWLFSHMDDPDIDVPVDPSSSDAVGGSGQGDGEKVAQLGDMGIDPAVARKALKETDGDVNRALDWVFSHPDEVAGLDDDSSQPPGGEVEANTGLPGSSTLPANFQLESIVCHKGGSVHAGHYVAFIQKPLPDSSETTWVLYNDEKVVQAENVKEMKQFAYIYFFGKVSA